MKLEKQDDYRLLGAALVVRHKLAKGVIKEHEFDMGTFSSKRCVVASKGCNTIHCIGGWMDIELGGEGMSPLDSLRLSDSVGIAANELFFPNDQKMENATRKDALKALDNFLALKSDPWRGVKVTTKKGNR